MLDDYNKKIQELFLEMMLDNAELFVRVQNIFNVDNFDSTLQETADFMLTHSMKFNSLPDKAQVNAITGLKFDDADKTIEDDWFLEEFEAFTRRQELERAIIKSADLLEKNDHGPIEKLIKDAVQISLTKDMGTDYFDDPRSRLEAIRNNNGQITTGWPILDDRLYGGFNRGELQIFAGGSGSGKSLIMQNLSVNWLEQGYNGVFISLELSEELCSMRLDSMMTDIASKGLLKKIDDVELKVKMKAKKCGNFRVKYMPAQSNVNDIRAYIKELHVQTGIDLDFMCIDYLDLLMPATAKVSPNDLFVKDKYVSEEIRNLGKELNLVTVTASQLNRSAVEEIEFDHSMISGGISKINTADNVFGIFTSRAMTERGRIQIQLMKTRSSAGVGQKIDLAKDPDTLRILDAGFETDEPGMGAGGSTGSAVMNSIKNKTTVNDPGANSGKISAGVSPAKLNGLLNKVNKKL